MENFFQQTYVALRGPTGAPQNATDTVIRLSDRLSPATLLQDRRASVLALKGLARDCKADVGQFALPGLLQVLANDASIDEDIGKAVLETLNILCDTEDATTKELGFRHTDLVLADDKATFTLFSLLRDPSFYTRLVALQFLSTLLQNRRQVVQRYFLIASGGPASVIAVLEDTRDIIRNEGINMVQLLVSQSPDIQKILAFEGALERLFNTVSAEGGIEGGFVTHQALSCVDSLLRFNTSNQSYFRETPFSPLLCSLLLFPPNIPIQEPAPQEFALQFWDTQKLANASLVIAIIGMLIGSKGSNNQDASTSAFIRCLVEIALASNAPTPLKTESLRLLPTTLTFPLSSLILTPYMPVPDSNGEEWDRLEASSALDALVELALNGEYANGVAANNTENGNAKRVRIKDALDLRCGAVAVFENFVRNEEIRMEIVHGMLGQQDPTQGPPATTPLLHALALPPASSGTTLEVASVTSTHLAALLFAHLLRSSGRAKALARDIKPAFSPSSGGTDNFFVPADGAPAPEPVVEEEEEEPQTLLQTLSENLSLALLSRSRADTSERDAREWDRLVATYLCLLAQWLWEDPVAVSQFLESGGLGVLVEPINQSSEVDIIVPGLCAFLLGICYEFNREPGEITRSTIYPILTRLGIDTLVGRMVRLREDERFKAIGPDDIVLPYPTPSALHMRQGLKPESEGEVEIWFDWAFVDFWKSNYYTVQRAFSTEPNQLSSASGQNMETAMLVASLRQVIQTQTAEISSLQEKLSATSAVASEANTDTAEIDSLKTQVESLSSQLQDSEEKRKEVEKEQEDLLVLLDEVSGKRRKDKERMRGAGLEVSEDEAEEDDDE